MENIFLKDGQTKITYKAFLKDIKMARFYFPFCCVDNISGVFKNLLLSGIVNGYVHLLDFGFTKSELLNLIIDESLLKTQYLIGMTDIVRHKDIESWLENAYNWQIYIYTSGTTGIPKKVSHSYKSLTRAIRKDSKHKDDVWGFAYNPTHMAGLQVFFQAFINQNPLINIFNKPREEILDTIDNNKITHISATPSFFRSLLPFEKKLLSVKQLTSGGERFDSDLRLRLGKIFPNAKFTNIYASTEAGTLFTTKDDEVFVARDSIREFIKIHNNELFIHKSMLGKSDSFELIGNWYPTGDMIKIVNEKPFSFIFQNRKSEIIDVRGFQINPYEIEECLNSHSQINNSIVYEQTDSTNRNTLCADIQVTNHCLTLKEIRKYLLNRLQPYKIPRIINIVDKISTTRTGKIKRY